MSLSFNEADKRISPETFVRTWWQSPNVDALCDILKVDRRWASNYAAYLRRNGVVLKNMPAQKQHGSYPPIHNIGALKLIAEQERSIMEANLARKKISEAARY